MRLATIDLGTNTVRLLVAESAQPPAWRLVHQEQQVTRLGEGLWPHRTLRETPMTRTMAAVAAYVERARALGAGKLRIVATSAVREATNGRAYAAALEARTGVPVEIVSGADEARLTVRGVLDALGELSGTVVVFDIGGGSTEYVVAGGRDVVASVSLHLGVVHLAERYPFPDRVDPRKYQVMEDEVTVQLARELPAAIAGARLDHLVGTAGTVTSLAALDLGLATYDPVRVHGHRLDRDTVARQLARLGALTLRERAQVPCLEPGRADLIVAGIAIVLATMRVLGTSSLVVSDAGLREGMMSEAVELGYSGADAS
jgi:exopolyphosphatase/guanosine-5'-triphosphate,3'-diphosphate pyrophosphatase